MRSLMLATAAMAMFAVTACTQDEVDKTVLGAAIGAVAGEAAFDKPLEGAAVGGAVGYAAAQ